MLTDTACEVTYEGGGGGVLFPIPFHFPDVAFIEAATRDGSGGETALRPGVDYQVAVMGEGGELTLLAGPLPVGVVLAIRRTVPMTQEIAFHNQGPNSPRATEDAVDKLTMIAQQLSGRIDTKAPLPAGMTEEEMVAALQGLGPGQAEIRAELADVSRRLDNKADLDDPRFGESQAASAHAASHAAAGADPVAPASIGCLPRPPNDGKYYLATAGGWVEYTPSSGGGEGGGTIYHSELLYRGLPDQHPQEAVTGLAGDLAAIRGDVANLSAVKAPVASPALTGTPTAPTPAIGTNNTQVATTAYVKAQGYAALASPTFTGTPKAPTPTSTDNSVQIATTSFVKEQGYARAEVHSYVEQDSGATWVNGKKIYRKTIDTGALLNAANKSVAHNIANVDRIIMMTGECSNGINFITIPGASPTATANIGLYATTTTVEITTGNNRTGYSGTVTLYYTCTDR